MVPAKGEDDAVGVHVGTVWRGVLVGVETAAVHVVLVRQLGDEVPAAEPYSAGDILLPLIMHEIGILPLERRVDGDHLRFVKRTLERIAGIDIQTSDGHYLHSCAE